MFFFVCWESRFWSKQLCKFKKDRGLFLTPEISVACFLIFCIIFIGNICLFHLSIVSIFLIFPCPTIPEIFRGHPGVLPQDLRSLVEQLDAKATTLIAFCVTWDGEMEMSLSGSKALRPRSFNLTHIYWGLGFVDPFSPPSFPIKRMGGYLFFELIWSNEMSKMWDFRFA